MTRVVMVAGTYRPERCGVAHYTSRLRGALDERGVSSGVLTTREAARGSEDQRVKGVVSGWGMWDLPALVRAVRRERPDVQVELEADQLEQVRAFLRIPGVDVILLDNMKPTEMREAVALGQKKGVKFEASGGVTLKNIRQIAGTGVDYISVGALTHSARAVDLSMELTHVAAG